MCCFPWNLPVYSKVTVPSYCNSSLKLAGEGLQPKDEYLLNNPYRQCGKVSCSLATRQVKSCTHQDAESCSYRHCTCCKRKRDVNSLSHLPCRWKKQYESTTRDTASEELLTAAWSPESYLLFNGVESCPVQDSVASVC